MPHKVENRGANALRTQVFKDLLILPSNLDNIIGRPRPLPASFMARLPTRMARDCQLSIDIRANRSGKRPRVPRQPRRTRSLIRERSIRKLPVLGARYTLPASTLAYSKRERSPGCGRPRTAGRDSTCQD